MSPPTPIAPTWVVLTAIAPVNRALPRTTTSVKVSVMPCHVTESPPSASWRGADGVAAPLTATFSRSADSRVSSKSRSNGSNEPSVSDAWPDSDMPFAAKFSVTSGFAPPVLTTIAAPERSPSSLTVPVQLVPWNCSPVMPSIFTSPVTFMATLGSVSVGARRDARPRSADVPPTSATGPPATPRVAVMPAAPSRTSTWAAVSCASSVALAATTRRKLSACSTRFVSVSDTSPRFAAWPERTYVPVIAPTVPPVPIVAPAALIVTVPVKVRASPEPLTVNVENVSDGAVIVRSPPRLTFGSSIGVVGIALRSWLAISVMSASTTGEAANALKCGRSATSVPVAAS